MSGPISLRSYSNGVWKERWNFTPKVGREVQEFWNSGKSRLRGMMVQSFCLFWTRESEKFSEAREEASRRKWDRKIDGNHVYQMKESGICPTRSLLLRDDRPLVGQHHNKCACYHWALAPGSVPYWEKSQDDRKLGTKPGGGGDSCQFICCSPPHSFHSLSL